MPKGMITPIELLNVLSERLPDCTVSLHQPGHAVADRELTAQDHTEAQRLADEEWSIVITPKRA